MVQSIPRLRSRTAKRRLKHHLHPTSYFNSYTGLHSARSPCRTSMAWMFRRWRRELGDGRQEDREGTPDQLAPLHIACRTLLLPDNVTPFVGRACPSSSTSLSRKLVPHVSASSITATHCSRKGIRKRKRRSCRMGGLPRPLLRMMPPTSDHQIGSDGHRIGTGRRRTVTTFSAQFARSQHWSFIPRPANLQKLHSWKTMHRFADAASEAYVFPFRWPKPTTTLLQRLPFQPPRRPSPDLHHPRPVWRPP